MPDLSWSGWSTIVSILLALIPTVFRFRQVLFTSKDLVTEIVGLVVLMAGLLLYAVTVPQWLQIQGQIAQLSAHSSPTLAQEIQSLHILFFGSIGVMMLGGLLTVFGLIGRLTGRLTTSTKKK